MDTRQYRAEALTCDQFDEPSSSVRCWRAPRSQDYLKARGTWTRITWNDRAKRLTIEPGAPTGATNRAGKRVFKLLLLPEGSVRDLSYAGVRVQISF